MICKNGVATRRRDYENCRAAAVDNGYRSFDQVIHEMSHSIDANDDILKNYAMALYQTSANDAAELFPWDVQRRFGSPAQPYKTKASGAYIEKLFPTSTTFSCDGYVPGK
jgi:hypothetical protein